MANTLIDAPRSANDGHAAEGLHLPGLIVAGVGAFLFVICAMVHFYAAPALAVAPINQNSVTELQAKDATLFDARLDQLKTITTDLTIKAHTTGDVAASKAAPGGARVWVNTTVVKSADGVERSKTTKRAAFDKSTAEAVNCCGGYMETEQGVREQVKRSGLMYKFPFGTEKKTYRVWDDTAEKAISTSYRKTAKIQGTEVYVFENEVPATVVGTRDLPAKLLGLPGEENVTADSTYQNRTTYYVEPVTGAILNQVSDTRSWFEYDGHELVTTDAHIAYTPKQVTSLLDDMGARLTLFKLAQGIVPWLVALLGLGLVAAGARMARRRA